MIGDSSFLSKNQNTTEKKEDPMYQVEVVRDFSEENLRDILEAYFKGMPWTSSDDNEYFREMLEEKRNIHVLLRREGKAVGYLLAKPQDLAAMDKELTDADPEFKSDSERYYVETMSIAPEIQKTLSGGKMFFRMLQMMIDECQQRFGINKFSMHTRVGNGASEAVQKYFKGMVVPIRRIKDWTFYDGQDDTDYIEGTYVKK